MARVSIYLNFMGTTEEAFAFYARAFNSSVTMMQSFGDMGDPSLTEEDRVKILHAELPILDGTVLMATDMLESKGHELRIGNNTTINLEPDTLEEAQRLYDALSEGSTDGVPLQQMFWGAWWGTCLDRYGIRWMFNGPASG